MPPDSPDPYRVAWLDLAQTLLTATPPCPLRDDDEDVPTQLAWCCGYSYSMVAKTALVTVADTPPTDEED